MSDCDCVIDIANGSESYNNGSGSDNNTVDYHTVLTQQSRKASLVGIRRDPNGENYSYGVLVAPKYVVIGSRFNSGVQNDGSERIVVKSSGGYKEFPKYLATGYRAVSLYELGVASTRTPEALPDKQTMNLPVGTTLTTFGWVYEKSQHLLSERNVDVTSSDTCVTRNIWSVRLHLHCGLAGEGWLRYR